MFLRRDENILSILKVLSETYTPEVKNFRICACLADSKGNIISFGFPRRKSHPLQKSLSNNENKLYLHAEVDCLLRGMKKVPKEQRADLSLYLHRSKIIPGETKWSNGLCKPCESCNKLIKVFNIRKVLFSTEQGYELL